MNCVLPFVIDCYVITYIKCLLPSLCECYVISCMNCVLPFVIDCYVITYMIACYALLLIAMLSII